MSSFNDTHDIVSKLTLQEKVKLLSGIGACSTASNERLSIPSLQTSDGPHGLRGGGGRFFNPPPGYQLPSATALGATFDIDILRRVGELLGEEGQRKGVHVALAPTVCIQRSPLIGRGFEAYGEDPVLSGTLAAHFINGLQEKNVGACIKHYAAHDQSTNSKEDNVIMTQRTLRELHLLPFQIALAKSQPWAVMTAYQMINGLHASEDPFLIQQFDGLVLSDWWGTYSTSEAINAGMDVEMPGGPSVWRGRQLEEAVNCQKVSVQTIDKSVKRLLDLIRRTKASEVSKILEGTGDNTPESRSLVRKAANSSIVLLKNNKSILPLKAKTNLKYGLIGEHFEDPGTCGGGSSEVVPFYVSTPLEAFTEVLGEENIRYEPGCETRRWTPLITSGLYQPDSSEPGFVVEWFADDPSEANEPQCLHSDTTTSTSMYFSQFFIENVPDRYYMRARSTFVPEKDCKYLFALSVRGRARFYIDGKETIELWTSHPEKTDDTACFNTISMERFAQIDLQKGKRYELEIILSNVSIEGAAAAGGVRLGGKVVKDEDQAISDAVQLAREVDIPIVITGLNTDYEYEASDRKDLGLPGRENEMISRVCEANPNTVVVIQAGMPIAMPWIDRVHTLVHAWLGGQETGHAIADVLFGTVNPSGRLSVTFPHRIEDTPAFLNFGKTDRQILYGEGVFVGSRYYEKIGRAPMFHFGFGLSYTNFQYSNFELPKTFPGDPNHTMELSVEITNTGDYDGAEVIQVYISDLSCSLQRPARELKAFKKVHLESGQSSVYSIPLDKYAVSFWSEEFDQWMAEEGDFAVILARSANPVDEILRKTFRLESTFTWSGI